MARGLDAKEELKTYEEAKTVRRPYENDWKMAVAYCAPRMYASWQNVGGAPTPTTQEMIRRFAYDSTGTNCIPKWVSILNRIATPESQRWQKLQASDPRLMKSYGVRAYFDALNDQLFRMRYAPRARFQQTFGECYKHIGILGMGPVSLTWRKPSVMDKGGGFAYKAWSLRDVFVLVDDNGNVVKVYRRFWLNARQYKKKWGETGAPPCVAAELLKTTPSETTVFEFVHVLRYADEDSYDEDALDYRRHPVREDYICVKDGVYVGEEAGYNAWPMYTPRVSTDPDDPYGTAPASIALPALGGVSAMKKTVLKQGQKAVDPAYLAADDGVLSGRVDIRPGRINMGGVNSQGQPLVHRLETGDFRVAENLIAEERKDIEDSFFVTVFKVLAENPEMTATQAMQVVSDQASQLAPTMGRLQSELLGPNTEREISLLAENGKLPEMPPELVEAEGEYQIIYTSPLAKGQYAEDVSGYMRLQEMLIGKAQATNDPSPLDWLADDEAIPEIADFMSVRTRWINTSEVVKQKRAERQQQQREEALIKQAPAGAAIAKEAMKNGGGMPGVSNG